MIGVIGTVVLLPLALLGLVIGVVRFVAMLLAALVGTAASRLIPAG